MFEKRPGSSPGRSIKMIKPVYGILSTLPAVRGRTEGEPIRLGDLGWIHVAEQAGDAVKGFVRGGDRVGGGMRTQRPVAGECAGLRDLERRAGHEHASIHQTIQAEEIIRIDVEAARNAVGEFPRLQGVLRRAPGHRDQGGGGRGACAQPVCWWG